MGAGLLKYGDAAEYLGVSVETVKKLVGKGRITVYRLGENGGSVRFKPGDLDAYIESCRKVGAKRR